jgi:hypothetical protein
VVERTDNSMGRIFAAMKDVTVHPECRCGTPLEVTAPVRRDSAAAATGVLLVLIGALGIAILPGGFVYGPALIIGGIKMRRRRICRWRCPSCGRQTFAPPPAA